ncbi:MAG: alpha/beta hydrolase fold domain-containing protein [Bacteroidota bacterium]
MPSISYKLLRFVLRRRNAKDLWKGPEVKPQSMRKLDVKNPAPSLYNGCTLDRRQVLNTTVSILTPKGSTTDKVVLFFHGGGFVFGPMKEHWQSAAQIAKWSQTRVWMVDYPKTPEHQQPEVMENAMAVYEAAQESFDPSRIIFMGDSAGGHILLTLCLKLKDAGRALPACLIPVCPSVGSAHEKDPEVMEVNKRDFILDPGGLPSIGRWYFGEMNSDDPMVSPWKADLRGLPPIHCFIASDDILMPSERKFVRKAREDGVKIDVYEGEGLCHIWVMFPVKEGRQARKEIANIIQDA